MTNAIKALESKGYIVKARDNMCFGEIDEDCPVVYGILNPDLTDVYGADGIGPDQLVNWFDLPDLTAGKNTTATDTQAPAEDAERKTKAREWDDIHNEGGEGYNPYR